ncbi:hypothetical protein SLS62_010995 [Diatrype stigma]|uniref:Protein kinase domain-containing protein n=1 Tax=Diatrype stigma TaxID=117547 RepID=A0AAN9U931_9PEZI
MGKRKRQTDGSPELALPSCEGPKLLPFKHRKSPIQRGSRLDKHRSNASAADGYVFQVRIESKQYALKVFKFHHPEAERSFRSTYLGSTCAIDKDIFYTDPFYAERRAYGRIQEARDEGRIGPREQIAVKCHGYIFLEDQDRLYLEEKEHLDFCTDIIDTSLREVLGNDVRIRAIVKDLETDRTQINSKTVRRTLERVKRLNDLKIYNTDIRADNFVNCRLVDFGRAWTEPYDVLEFMDTKYPKEAYTWRMKDFLNFKEMIEDEEIKTTLKVFVFSRRQLRSRGKPQEPHSESSKHRRKRNK